MPRTSRSKVVESSAPSAPKPLTLDQRADLGVASLTAFHGMADGYLVARSKEIRLALTALVARQHLLLLGPPGVAKTFLAYLLGQACGGPYFEILLGRFTEPSQVFGPIDVPRLIQKGEQHYRTEGYLPTARVALTDEVFKASNAILNSLLTIMNERVFHNGPERVVCPLETIIGCSNEGPGSEELAPLYDRFLLRHEVTPVPKGQKGRLLQLGDCPPVPQIIHLDAVQARAASIPLEQPIQDAILDIVEGARAAGITVSDRRLRQSKSLVRASAALAGRKEMTFDDLGILASSFWETPDQAPAMLKVVIAAVNKAREAAKTPAPTPTLRPTQTPTAPKPILPPPVPTSTPSTVATNPLRPIPPKSGQNVVPLSVMQNLPSPQTYTDKRVLHDQLRTLITRSTASQVVADPWIHEGIDILLNSPISAVMAEEIQNWKKSIASQGGMRPGQVYATATVRTT